MAVILASTALLGTALAVPEGNQRQDAARQSLPSTICQASRMKIGAHGIAITLKADFISDGRERSLLVDSRCQKVLVVPYDDPTIVKNGGYRQFEQLLEAHALKVGLLTLRVTARGSLKRISRNKYRFDIAEYIESAEKKGS